MALAIATTPLQGEDVLSEISTDNGVTWKAIVCLIKQGVEATRNVNKTNTQCGQLIGKGTLDLNIPVEGAVNVDAPAGYVSYKDLQGMIKDFTSVMYRSKSPADGSKYYNGTNAYLTDLKLDVPVDNIATFSGTLTGWGDWAIAAP